MRIKRVFFILLSCVIILMTGCIREDLSDCKVKPSGVILKYDYWMNMDYANRFGKDVADLKVFFFDQDSVLCDTLVPIVVDGELSDEWERRVELAPGKYMIVTWAGDRGWGDSFDFVYREPADARVMDGIIVGQTRLSDLRTRLRQEVDPLDINRVVLGLTGFHDLFYGIQRSVVVNPEELTIVTTSLVKDTKVIRVKIGKLSGLTSGTPAMSDFDVQLIGRNGQYTYNNDADAEGMLVRYQGDGAMIENDSIREDITTLRLIKFQGDASYSSPLLTVVYKPGNVEICKDLDVTDLIMKSKIPARDSKGQLIKDDEGNVEMVYPTSEYLDRQDLFEIVFGISRDVTDHLVFTVYVNGWEIQNIVPVK